MAGTRARRGTSSLLPPRPDGAHHYQHWFAERSDQAWPVLHHGAHGHRDDPDGFAGLRMGLWPARAQGGAPRRCSRRGLTELIIINIGLQKEVIKPGLFSIMVLMAIVTTLMASPVFEWVYGRHARKAGDLGAAPAEA